MDDDVARSIAERLAPETGRRTRVQLVTAVPGSGRADAADRAEPLAYRRGAGRFRGMELVNRLSGATAASAEPAQHVLVCTHGKRDVCCGKLGTELLAELTDIAGAVNLWRTSHLGGHRFAPTVLFLPAGTMWAYVDAPLLRGLVNRDVEPTVAAAHYRGCIGLDGPEAQALDREMFIRYGWSWLDTPRSAELLIATPERALVRLHHEFDQGAAAAVEAQVVRGRDVPIVPCRSTTATSTVRAELRVERLAPVSLPAAEQHE